MQQRWNDGDTNDGKGVEVYINCKASLALNFWRNYQYTVDTTNFYISQLKFNTIIMEKNVT